MEKILIKFTEPEKLTKAKEVATKCESVSDSDRCEAAFKIAKCLSENAVV